MVRLVLLLMLTLVSACATQDGAAVGGSDVATAAAPAGEAAAGEADDGLSTETKVALGLGAGALAGLLLYASMIAVGTSAILAGG